MVPCCSFCGPGLPLTLARNKDGSLIRIGLPGHLDLAELAFVLLLAERYEAGVCQMCCVIAEVCVYPCGVDGVPAHQQVSVVATWGGRGPSRYQGGCVDVALA